MALAFILIMKNKAFDILKHNYDHLLLFSGGQQQRLGQNGHVYKYTHAYVACPVCFSKTAITRPVHTQNTQSTHIPQGRCERQRFCPVSSPQHTKTAPCCCHGHPCLLSGQGGSRTKSRRHFLALPLSWRGTPVACRPVAPSYSCCTCS